MLVDVILLIALILAIGYIVYLKGKTEFFKGIAAAYARELHEGEKD